MSAENLSDEKEADKPIQLGEWLQQWDLQKHQVLLQNNGIKKVKDFQYIKTKRHFDKLVTKLGAEMSVMDTFKLEDAWLSIVPSPQEEPKVMLLSVNMKKILNSLKLRYKDLLNDMDVVQNAFKDFTEQSVQCKKDIDKCADEMIQCIERKRKSCLDRVDSITNKKQFEVILNKLQSMNVNFQFSKDKFQEIAVDTKLNSKQKEQQMGELLALNIHNESDQKELNYNHYKVIGNKLEMPNKIYTVFQKSGFEKAVDFYLSVKCEEMQQAWTLKHYYRTFLDGKYEIKSVKTGKCVDVKGNSNSVGGMLHQWSAHGLSNQRFYVKQQPNGYYTVQCVCSSLYWKFRDGELIQDRAEENDDMFFAFVPMPGKDTFCIVTKNGKYCLHVPDEKRITQRDVNYSLEQLFYCKIK